MNVYKTYINGLLIIEPSVYGDERGFFIESHNAERYRRLGIGPDFVQDNLSVSARGVLRGLHFQNPPFEQGKLVQALKGKVLDTAVDIRVGSPTYGKSFSIELSAKNKRQFWIPAGFAHGFLSLEDDTIFSYKCTNAYNKESEGCLLWSDPHFNIQCGNMPFSDLTISNKDKSAIRWSEYVPQFNYAQYRVNLADDAIGGSVEGDFLAENKAINKVPDIKIITGRKILVTGGAGFIGSNFARYWIKKYPQDKIVNLDALTYAGNLENLKEVENNQNYRFVEGDIVDKTLVDVLMRQVDAVVHFAAESHVDRAIDSSAEFVSTNIEGIRVLLQSALENNLKRFHHISTDEVFGQVLPGDPPFNEKTPYNPRNPYSASKAAADFLARAYFQTHKLPLTISNCSNNYGPNQFSEKMHGLFITNILEGKKVPIYGDGLQVRDWLFVGDHCRAIDVILNKGKIGETYCIGGGTDKANIEVARAIIRLVLSKVVQSAGVDTANAQSGLFNTIFQSDAIVDSFIEYIPDRKGHDRKYAIDYTKIKNELGWEPSVSFNDGLEKTVEWYMQNCDWWKKIKK